MVQGIHISTQRDQEAKCMGITVHQKSVQEEGGWQTEGTERQQNAKAFPEAKYKNKKQRFEQSTS